MYTALVSLLVNPQQAPESLQHEAAKNSSGAASDGGGWCEKFNLFRRSGDHETRLAKSRVEDNNRERGFRREGTETWENKLDTTNVCYGNEETSARDANAIFRKCRCACFRLIFLFLFCFLARLLSDGIPLFVFKGHIHATHTRAHALLIGTEKREKGITHKHLTRPVIEKSS